MLNTVVTALVAKGNTGLQQLKIIAYIRTHTSVHILQYTYLSTHTSVHIPQYTYLSTHTSVHIPQYTYMYSTSVQKNNTNTCSFYYTQTHIHIHEIIPPCDTRRREKVRALYSTVSGLLAVISRAYPRFLSPAPRNI